MRHSPAADFCNGWRRWFLDRGESRDVIVMLHGIPTNYRLWSGVAAQLAGEYRVIAPDLTGFGLSDLPPTADLSPRGQAHDLFGLLDRIGVDRFWLVVHDYGFLVGCEMLSIQPGRVNGLVISNTSIRRTDWSGSGLSPFRLLKLPLVGEIAFKSAQRWMLELAFRPFIFRPESLSQEQLDAFWEPFERGFGETLLRLYREAAIDRTVEVRFRGSLREYRGPVTIVWGARDPVFRIDRAREIATLAGSADVVMLDYSSHFVPLDQPRSLARLIGRHVRRNRLEL